MKILDWLNDGSTGQVAKEEMEQVEISIINGDPLYTYELQKKIGKGSFGVVYEGEAILKNPQVGDIGEIHKKIENDVTSLPKIINKLYQDHQTLPQEF